MEFYQNLSVILEITEVECFSCVPYFQGLGPRTEELYMIQRTQPVNALGTVGGKCVCKASCKKTLLTSDSCLLLGI